MNSDFPPAPAPTDPASNLVETRQQRRRRTLALAVGLLFLLLLWLALLIAPSAPGSAAARARHVLFGERFLQTLATLMPALRPQPHPLDGTDSVDLPPNSSIGPLDPRSEPAAPTTPTQPGAGGKVPATTGSGTRAEASAVEPATNATAAPLPANAPRPQSRATDSGRPALQDNFEELLQRHRAGSGDVRISLMWNNHNDLDLHVIDPGGEDIHYRHPRAASGGVLDIDMNATPPWQKPAVENVFWPEQSAPLGRYRIYVHHFRQHERANETAFTVRALVRGRTTDYPGRVRFSQGLLAVHEFVLGPERTVPDPTSNRGREARE